MPDDFTDFTEREIWVIQTTAKERWGRVDIQLHPADVAVRMHPQDEEGTPCPALFWIVNQCNFVVVKTGVSQYRCQFFYNDLQQMGPDVTEYTELAECVVQLLQTQSDYARMTGRGPGPGPAPS